MPEGFAMQSIAPTSVAGSATSGKSTISSRPSGINGLELLRTVCSTNRLPELAARLDSLVDLVESDLGEVEATLDELLREQHLVERGAAELLRRRGKRLRPLCVALASRLGSGFGSDARDIAVAVELVHNATLLHDDVVDGGESRRGGPTTRAVFGNAVSIFAGDWLLVEALRRVYRTQVPQIFEPLLQTIDAMIVAESLQLEQRYRLDTSRDTYFHIIEGKTASLFAWAVVAGARAGGIDAPSAEHLHDYGRHLGLAFQLVDDVLDYAGDPLSTGKSLLGDLREGKVTLPLRLALEQQPTLRHRLEQLLRSDGNKSTQHDDLLAIHAAVVESQAAQATLAEAQTHADNAARSLSALPDSDAKEALAMVAASIVHRDN